MKKILAVLILFFAFNSSTYAQEEKKEELVVLAEKDSKDVVTFLELDNPWEKDFFNLFYKKYKDLAKISSEKEKENISYIITKKLEASLTPDNFEKLKKNTALYERVIN